MSQFCDHRNGNGIAGDRIVLISIGANLPDQHGRSPLESGRKAVALLDLFPSLRLIGLSRWFETAPVPPSGQPPYVNAVASLLVDPDATIDPGVLLARLMDLEAACGRTRGAPNAARALDLDIIAVGNLVRQSPDPILPHPRAHLRAFVLAPLAEVAPHWVHPALGRSAVALLAELGPQQIRAL